MRASDGIRLAYASTACDLLTAKCPHLDCRLITESHLAQR
jgi:hypothetical protein